MDRTDIFQKTQWTIVLKAADYDSDAAMTALSSLCQAYWYPLYIYARHRGRNEFEAEDLVQGFFSRLLSKREHFLRVTPEKGKFRAYLLTMFKAFMNDEYRFRTAEKRGGTKGVIEFDGMSAEERYRSEVMVAQVQGDDGKDYDRAWANELLRRVNEKLRMEYAVRQQQEMFDVMFENILTVSADYENMAHRLNVSNNTMRVTFSRFRKRWRRLLYQEVAETICSESNDDIEKEIEYLISCIIDS